MFSNIKIFFFEPRKIHLDSIIKNQSSETFKFSLNNIESTAKDDRMSIKIGH